ncbi:MAG: hypothetical protein CM1200mP6_06600 [Anaerolineaceae bacterium]|nr:MAG: hypothetical protein CM1200mP6_06600 [Anaerolineaceae bacterium]
MRLIRHILEILQGARKGYDLISYLWCDICWYQPYTFPLLIRRMIEWIVEGGADESDLIGVTVSLFGLYLLRGGPPDMDMVFSLTWLLTA